MLTGEVLPFSLQLRIWLSRWIDAETDKLMGHFISSA